MAEETTRTETTVHTTETHTEEKKSTLLSDILSIIGFAILFIIIIWGLIHLVSLSSGWFSSLFYHPAPTVQVEAPASATSGQPMSISWTYAPSVAGNYAFLYECENGLQFETSSAATSSYLGIPCGVAYTVGNATSSLTLVPMLSGTTSVPDTLSIVFIPNASGSEVQGSATTTVNAAIVTEVQPTTPAKPAPKPAATIPQTTYSGPADLSVRIISENVDQNGNATVSFDIANVGGSTSPAYYFSADLPTTQAYPYQSPLQSPLTAGSHIVDTLRFNEIASGGGMFSVSLNVNDANSSNNYASIEISAPYSSYNNPAPYTVYPTYTY